MSLLAVGCDTPATGVSTADPKIKIVASLFPQYDFAKKIAGDKAEVRMLLPPGAESHSYDPSPRDTQAIYESGVFIYTGKGMEPWAQRIIDGVRNDGLLIIDASNGIKTEATDETHDDDSHDDTDSHGTDPHIWLNISNAITMADNIAAALIAKYPTHAEYFSANAATLKNELLELDAQFVAAMQNKTRDTIVFAGRFAYIYFIERYGLNYKSAYDSCSTLTEPSVRTVAQIIDFINENKIPCVYHEELAEPKLARQLERQTGAKALLFSTAHNVTKDQFAAGISYVDVMRGNLENLLVGIGQNGIN